MIDWLIWFYLVLFMVTNFLFSGLEVRDRLWLKISIPHAFIGKDNLTKENKPSYLYNCCGTGKNAKKDLFAFLQFLHCEALIAGCRPFIKTK
jgi:hypothetical protein